MNSGVGPDFFDTLQQKRGGKQGNFKREKPTITIKQGRPQTSLAIQRAT